MSEQFLNGTSHISGYLVPYNHCMVDLHEKGIWSRLFSYDKNE